MNRDDLNELHYITPIVNIGSILEHGILSNRRVAKLQHQSVAKQEVQNLRAMVRLPGGHALHEYANLYVCARNPMLYKRQGVHRSLCVLKISTSVLDRPGVIITDQNAASGYRRFSPAPGGLSIVNQERVFAEYWTHPENPIDEWRHKSEKCAEVLVPDSVDPSYIFGAYVSNAGTSASLTQQAPGLQVIVNTHLFFR